MKTDMKLVLRPEGSWWITNMPDGEHDCGPYDTKGEAEEARKGMARTFRTWDDDWTTETSEEEDHEGDE